MKYICTSLVLLACSWLVVSALKSKSNTDKCKICSELVENLIKGLKKTSKGNFGGGNTDWEDRKLGNYLTSETRFEEISETLCKETDCHQFLEEHEEYLFEWFKNKQKRIEPELYNEFCVSKVKFCCPKETYGPECTPCKRIDGLICGGHGRCQGEGTREGTGDCLCNYGYTGEQCTNCAEGHFEESKNETYIKCGECHRSCKACSGSNADQCLACKNGWLFDESTKLCRDIDECLKEGICGKNEFCVNNEGSYYCEPCDQACKGCTGRGSNKCVECKSGYRELTAGNCQDVNECEETPGICGENKDCRNTPGSYECKEIIVNETKTDDNAKRNQDDTEDNELDDDYDEDDDEEEHTDNKNPKAPVPNLIKNDL